MFAGVNFDAWRRLFFFLLSIIYFYQSVGYSFEYGCNQSAGENNNQNIKTSTTINNVFVIKIASLLAPIHLASVVFKFPNANHVMLTQSTVSCKYRAIHVHLHAYLMKRHVL